MGIHLLRLKRHHCQNTPCKYALVTNLTNGIGLCGAKFHVFRAKKRVFAYILVFMPKPKNDRHEVAEHMTWTSGYKRVPIAFYEVLKIHLPPLEVQYITHTIAHIEYPKCPASTD
ncbi:restriction endonuclease subunit S domain-containing protein [Helicobacter heilmannii]|uniref:hypothetical protein n=1 Tax=Helicobacter heilmannii TaxID=35817 RepID=UPI000CF0EAC4|nr:hypothetical protein [Helicobacter heilmannii]